MVPTSCQASVPAELIPEPNPLQYRPAGPASTFANPHAASESPPSSPRAGFGPVLNHQMEEVRIMAGGSTKGCVGLEMSRARWGGVCVGYIATPCPSCPCIPLKTNTFRPPRSSRGPAGRQVQYRDGRRRALHQIPPPRRLLRRSARARLAAALSGPGRRRARPAGRRRGAERVPGG